MKLLFLFILLQGFSIHDFHETIKVNFSLFFLLYSRFFFLLLSCLGHVPFRTFVNIFLCMDSHLILNRTEYVDLSTICLLQTFIWSLCLFIIREWKFKSLFHLLTAAIVTMWWKWQELKWEIAKWSRQEEKRYK